MRDVASHYANKLLQDDSHFLTLKGVMRSMLKSPLRVATACSGTDGIIKWLGVFSCVLGSLGVLPPVGSFFDFLFACEFDKDIYKFHTDQFGSSVSLFQDIRDLGQEFGAFEVHSGALLLVPWVSLFICGFSCKDVSIQSSRKRERSDTIRTGMHSTGSTWHGVLDYLANNRPWVCLCENVEGLLSHLDDMQKQVAAVGYQLRSIRLNADQFCLPQKRPRVFLIITVSGYDFPWAEFCKTIDFLKTPPLDIRTVLASSRGTSCGVEEFGSSGIEEPGDAPPRRSKTNGKGPGEKWIAQHQAIFEAAGLPFVIPTDDELGSCASAGMKSLTLRERSIVEYWLSNGCTEGFLDVSESLDRFQPIHADRISCITCSSVHYDFGVDELLSLPAQWNLQGLDWNSWENLARYPYRLLKTLVGNSFSVPNMAAVVLALLLSLQWPRSEQEQLIWMKRGIPREPAPPSPDIEDDTKIFEFGCSGVDAIVEDDLSSEDDVSSDEGIGRTEVQELSPAPTHAEFQDLAELASLC